MVEPTVEGFRKMLDVMARLRDQNEARATEASCQLVRLLEKYAPGEVDRRVKAGEMLDSLPISALADLLEKEMDKRNAFADRLVAMHGVSAEKVTQAETDIARYKDEVNRSEVKIGELERENQTLRIQLIANWQATEIQSHEENEASKEIDYDLMPAQPKRLSTADSIWLEKWKITGTFERDSACLRLIGETGLSRRPVLEKKLAEMFGIRSTGGSITGLIERMQEMGLLEIFRPWKEGSHRSIRGGHYPDLIRLTEKGMVIYQVMFQLVPMGCEYDILLPMHVTPEHTLLNLYAKDILCNAGYELVTIAPEILLPNARHYKPDLVVKDADGSILYIEVERDTRKSLRERKWQNAHAAGGGKIYVLCENRTCMATIRNEINCSMEDNTLYISNIPDLLAGKRGENDSIWMEVSKKNHILSGNHEDELSCESLPGS
jgi:hypothetical protein